MISQSFPFCSSQSFSFTKNRYIYILFLFVFLGCKNNTKDVVFTSDFSDLEKQTWLGANYWANPLQDWQVNANRIECLVSDTNRNVHLLTHKLSEESGGFQMDVNLGFFNKSESTDNSNWAGFTVGSKGKFSDYRDDAVYGKGINIGVFTNGGLFIGDQVSKERNEEVIKHFTEGIQMSINATLDIEDTYVIVFTIKDPSTNKTLASITKNNIPKENLVGDLVLVSDFKNTNKEKVNYTKSVWFSDWGCKGTKLKEYPENSFGPILFSQYTLSRNTLKLTAQMAPVAISSDNLVDLQVRDDSSWKTIQSVTIDAKARTARFKIGKWDDTKELPYRLVYTYRGKDFYWEGTFRKNPKDKEEIVVAGFTGNNDLGFPNTDIVNQVEYQDPDMLFFSGDQIYEEVGGYYIQRDPLDIAVLDYLRKWYMYGWAYRDILKDRPAVVITDDHDVYMGNVWGESGKATIKTGTRKEVQDSGGYRMQPEWVNMVERTQTSHLPDPYDPTPVKRGIGVYYTQMNYGGISYAILEDRKFKSAPKALLPHAKVENGWPLNKDFNMRRADVKGAKLLGERQLKFLDQWASDWSHGAHMKTVLSQTIFANVATLPKEAMTDAVVPTLRILNKGEYPENDYPVTDMDSNGWPQTGRKNAVSTIRKGFAFHLAGDQHLGSTIQYGLDDYSDASFAFCVPSISNYWPRRWYPFDPGANRDEESPEYTGDFKDGFGNKMTVHAISNPIYTKKKPSALYDRAAGYGLVRFNKSSRKIKIECWPRGANPKNGDKEQYFGWPITIDQEQNFGKKVRAYLPKLIFESLTDPVVQVINESTKEVVYTIRVKGNSYTPKVFRGGRYTIIVSDPDKDVIIEKKHIYSEHKSVSELVIKQDI